MTGQQQHLNWGQNIDGTFQNIPFLNFYSMTLFLSSDCYSLPPCCLYHGFLALWKGLLSLIPLCPAPSMLVKFGMWMLLHSPALKRAQGSFLFKKK